MLNAPGLFLFSWRKLMRNMRKFQDLTLKNHITVVCYFNTLFYNFFSPVNVIPPCGTLLDCSLTPDGQYADKIRFCMEWFTCHEKNYKGHTACPKGKQNVVFLFIKIWITVRCSHSILHSRCTPLPCRIS